MKPPVDVKSRGLLYTWAVAEFPFWARIKPLGGEVRWVKVDGPYRRRKREVLVQGGKNGDEELTEGGLVEDQEVVVERYTQGHLW